jgi:hypothetical protein
MSPDMATTTTSPRFRPIPQPPPRPLLGNLTDIDKEDAIGSITQMIRRYGEIVKLQVPNGPKNGRLFIGSQRLVHEIVDQERFEKVVSGALEEVRSLAGDGTFASPIDVGTHRDVVWSGLVWSGSDTPLLFVFTSNFRPVHRLYQGRVMASLSPRPSSLILIRCPTLKLTFPILLFLFFFFCA